MITKRITRYMSYNISITNSILYDYSKKDMDGMHTTDILDSVYRYSRQCIVQDRQLDNIVRMIWDRIDNDRYTDTGIIDMMNYENIKHIHDTLDDMIYNRYYTIPSDIHIYILLMIRLNGIVNKKTYLSIWSMYNGSTIQDSMHDIIYSRYIRSRSIKLFIDNLGVYKPYNILDHQVFEKKGR